MNVNFIRLKGVVRELALIRQELTRLNDLRELELQKVHGLTTHVVTASEKQLLDTQVSYNDAEYTSIVERMERAKGRKLSEEELENIAAVLSEIETE